MHYIPSSNLAIYDTTGLIRSGRADTDYEDVQPLTSRTILPSTISDAENSLARTRSFRETPSGVETQRSWSFYEGNQDQTEG